MITKSIDTLRIKSEDFQGTDEDLKVIIENLEFELNRHKGDSVGLSAIQIGVPQKVAIIRLHHKIKFHGVEREMKESYNLYNAKIVSQSNLFKFKGEGCLSFPNEFCTTERYNQITVVNGDGKEYKFSGFTAVVVQHELDHWNGVVFKDREVK